MVRSSIRQTPAQRRDAVASEVAALCATGAQYRRALHILAAQHRYERLCIAGLVAGFALLIAALWVDTPMLYVCAAGAFTVTLVAWAIAFADWS